MTPSPTPISRAKEAPSITIYPATVQQGEPLLVSISNSEKSTEVKGITFDGTPLGLFSYKSKPSAFIGIDLAKKPGAYTLTATFADGSTLKKTITVLARAKIQAPLGIPEKLGGNTPQAASQLVTTMAKEGQTLLAVKSTPTQLWSGPFIFPVKNPIVTDAYGYTRDTVGYAITHKGTDFHAPEGTPVMAINSGIVRVVQKYEIYGNTVIVDHGDGLLSMYMHLSQAKVKVGDKVTTGDIIALSGETGYAESPHLHLTIRINNISIDPMKFFALFP